MTPEEFLKTRGFSPKWLEESVEKDDQQDKALYNRKDLNTLLSELEDIKNEFEKITLKKEYLKNLLNFYSKFLFN